MQESASRFASGEIRAHLARHRRTQAELAGVLGITQTSVSNRLTGLVAWDIDELTQVAKFLGVPLTDLLPDGDKASA